MNYIINYNCFVCVSSMAKMLIYELRKKKNENNNDSYFLIIQINKG